MNSPCNTCGQADSSKRCGACRKVYYCSETCQKNDWKSHKPNCLNEEKTIQACLVDGDQVIEQQIAIKGNELTDRTIWHICRVPTMLGVPLVVKRLGPSTNIQDREIAVFMMVDPVTGFAPLPWQSGAHQKLGRLLFAFADGRPLSFNMVWSVYSYIYDLMDLYSDGKEDYVQRNKLNPSAFNKYKKEEERMQANYQRQLDV
jgi:hypothetical protein